MFEEEQCDICPQEKQDTCGIKGIVEWMKSSSAKAEKLNQAHINEEETSAKLLARALIFCPPLILFSDKLLTIMDICFMQGYVARDKEVDNDKLEKLMG